MKAVTFKCPNCNANLSFPEGISKVECEYCGSVVTLQEEVDKVQKQNESGIKELTDRIYDLIRQEEFLKVKEAAEEGLKAYPYAGRLHLCLLMAELEITKPSMLGDFGKDYTTSINYQNCIRYMTSEDKKDLLSLAEKNKSATPKEFVIGEYEKINVHEEPTMVEKMITLDDQFREEMDNAINEGIAKMKENYVNESVSQEYGISVEKLGELFDIAVNRQHEQMKPVMTAEEGAYVMKSVLKRIKEDYINMLDEIDSDARPLAENVPYNSIDDNYYDPEDYAEGESNEKGKMKSRGLRFAIWCTLLLAIVFAIGLILAFLGHSIGNLILLISGIIDLVIASILFFVVDYRNKYICPQCGKKRVHHRQFLRTTETVKQSTVMRTYEYKHHYLDTYVCENCGCTKRLTVSKYGGKVTQSFSSGNIEDNRKSPIEF